MNKTYETLKNIIKKTITLQYYNTMEYNQEEFCKEDEKEYKKATQRYKELFENLHDSIPKESQELLSELDDIKNTIAILEHIYYFKQGVVSGLTDLKFLEESDGIISII